MGHLEALGENKEAKPLRGIFDELENPQLQDIAERIRARLKTVIRGLTESGARLTWNGIHSHNLHLILKKI